MEGKQSPADDHDTSKHVGVLMDLLWHQSFCWFYYTNCLLTQVHE